MRHHERSLRFVRNFVCILAFSIASFLAASASASQYNYCYQSIDDFQWCPAPGPSYAVGDRHTFVDMFGNWGTVVHSGCDLQIRNTMYVAYTSSNASLPKYEQGFCNFGYLSFPNNTQLLRGYIITEYPRTGNHFLWGNASY